MANQSTCNHPSTIPPPDLHIPPSNHTVTVSIINTTSTIRGAKTSDFFGPPIKGHDWLAAPVFSFLIQHDGPDGPRNLLFDLGIRKDWQNSAPSLVNHLKSIQNPPWTLHTDKSVTDILSDAATNTTTANNTTANATNPTIEAIIWSHHHFDHTGNPSLLPPSTSLIVGPGVSHHLLPGYPTNPLSTLLESDYANRELIELDFATGNGGRWKTLMIGRFRAIDYFGDGSLYLLDAPGHAVGHVCALARVTVGQKRREGEAQERAGDSFVFLAGDAIHHVGELRPSRFIEVPHFLGEEFVAVSGGGGASNTKREGDGDQVHVGDVKEGNVYPGSLFTALLPDRTDGGGDSDGIGSFYRPSGSCACHTLTVKGSQQHTPAHAVTKNENEPEDKDDKPQWHHDPDETAQTVQKVQEFDAQENILVMAAHDESLLDVVDFFPATLNDFMRKAWASKARWRFLADFVDAVGAGEEVKGGLLKGVMRRDWGPVSLGLKKASEGEGGK